MTGHAPSVAQVNAGARAAGNQRAVARAIAGVLFETVWPAQVTKVRVDGFGRHRVAGLLLSGTKFHGALDVAGFTAEVGALVRETFATADVEEVDLWATVPIRVAKDAVVSGDYAKPVSRIVFALTVRRPELSALAERLKTGRDVYWASDWKAALQVGNRGPGSQSR